MLTPAGLKVAGCEVNGKFLPYGIPVGIQHQLSLKVQKVALEVVQIVKVLEREGQGIWTIARSSTAMKLDFHKLPKK